MARCAMAILALAALTCTVPSSAAVPNYILEIAADATKSKPLVTDVDLVTFARAAAQRALQHGRDGKPKEGDG
eukprot:8488281-Pyramimonas_sp.AAC.1